nr:NUDIX hydrolase [Mesobacillus harenae]
MVNPRPASTVILMDQMSRVYLTKRPMTMKFLGGYFVFPGGAVEREDDLTDTEYIKDVNNDQPISLSHYIAAARELFEEAGVFLGEKDDGSAVQFEPAKEMDYRKRLVKGEMAFIELLKNEGCHLNLKCLQYFGHQITPKESPIRFDTRFFLAELPKEQYPKPDSREIAEAIWITPDEALAAYQKGEMPMVFPTLLSLQTIMSFLNGGPLMMPRYHGSL